MFSLFANFLFESLEYVADRSCPITPPLCKQTSFFSLSVLILRLPTPPIVNHFARHIEKPTSIPLLATFSRFLPDHFSIMLRFLFRCRRFGINPFVSSNKIIGLGTV